MQMAKMEMGDLVRACIIYNMKGGGHPKTRIILKQNKAGTQNLHLKKISRKMSFNVQRNPSNSKLGKNALVSKLVNALMLTY